MQRMLGLCGANTADCIAMSMGEIGLLYGTVAGVGGAVGTLLGGYLADHRGDRDRRWFLWIPMWGKIIGGPLFVASMFAPTAELSLLLYFPAIGLAAMYLGPSLAITHHLVPAGMRAMSSAVLFFIINMVGQGLGPTAVGALSKWLGESTGLGDASLQWSMAAAVVAMYPLSILWHWGAQRLPKARRTRTACRDPLDKSFSGKAEGRIPRIPVLKAAGQVRLPALHQPGFPAQGRE